MFTQAEKLIVERCDRELLVFVPRTNEAHSLNASAAVIFECCDGATTPAQMVAALDAAGLPADETIVKLALADLSEASLIVIEEPQVDSRMTRRRVIRRLGLSAAAIATLPVIEMIVVQPAAAQASAFSAPTTTPTPSTTSATTTTTTTPTPSTTPGATTTPAAATTPPATTTPGATTTPPP